MSVKQEKDPRCSTKEAGVELGCGHKLSKHNKMVPCELDDDLIELFSEIDEDYVGEAHTLGCSQCDCTSFCGEIDIDGFEDAEERVDDIDIEDEIRSDD